MEHSFEHIEQFEAYQSKTMTEKELLAFEARLSYDKEFKAEFTHFQRLEEGIKQHFRTELKNKLNELDNELVLDNTAPPKNNVKKLYWVTSAVAASLIIGIFLFNFYNSERKYTELAQQYWPVEEGLPVKMSAKGIYDDAMNAYKQEQWQEAENLLVAINSDTASYFLGVINYQQKEFDKSASYFSQIPEPSFWFEQSQYRLALTYLNLNKVEEAKRILKTFSDTSPLKKDAEHLLLEL